MWTRLLYQNSLKDAFTPHFIKGRWMPPLISNRYRQMLKKEFRLAHVPWPLETIGNSPKINPRNKKPKGHKDDQLKMIKLDKIKKAISNTDEVMLKYRQERLNNRRVRGNDYLVSKALPPWLHFNREDYFESQKEAAKTSNRMSDDENDKKFKKKKVKVDKAEDLDLAD